MRQTPLRPEAFSISKRHESVPEKLIDILEFQKNSPTLQLGETFLGDEGCAALGRYLEEHDTFSGLDLHGNNITGTGITYLCKYLAKTVTLKELSLEWNNIGLSVQGLEMVCGALSENKSISSVDLRNNRISSAAPLASLIRSNGTIQRLDLRWNELGTEGAKTLVPSLERNRFLSELELSGNKISEDVMNVIDDLIERNKGDNRVKSDRVLRESMRQKLALSLDFPKENVIEEVGYLEKGEKDILDVKARYDAQIIAHERTERKLEDAEKLLEQEREKNGQLRQDLLKGIDIEKEQKERMQEEMGRMKENFMKEELRYTKQIQDIELQRENESLKKTEISLEDSYKSKVSNLEETVEKRDKEIAVLTEQSAKDLEKAKRDYEAEVKSLNQSWAGKFKTLQTKYGELETELNETVESLRQAQSELSHSKIEKEQALGELESKLRHEMGLQVTLTAKGLEDKIKALESTKEGLNAKIAELMEEVKQGEKKYGSMVIKFEKETNGLRQEISNLQKEQAIKFADHEKLEKEIAISSSIIERNEIENKTLNEEIGQVKASAKEKLQLIQTELENERRNGQKMREDYNSTIARLEQQIRDLKVSIATIRQQEETLCDNIVKGLTTGIQKSFDKFKKDSHLKH